MGTMSTADLLDAIDRIRDELAEARRFVRHPRPPDIHDTVTAMLRLPLRAADLIPLHRLAANLGVGVAAVRVAPAVLESYIDDSLWELAVLRGRLEREGGETR